jgi:hypothetical protein
VLLSNVLNGGKHALPFPRALRGVSAMQITYSALGCKVDGNSPYAFMACSNPSTPKMFMARFRL